jgi:hypothetical protein
MVHLLPSRASLGGLVTAGAEVFLAEAAGFFSTAGTMEDLSVLFFVFMSSVTFLNPTIGQQKSTLIESFD